MPNIKKTIVNIRNCILGIHCEADWNSMQIVSQDSETESEIKFCNSCQKEVYECNDDDELARNVKLNRCVRFYDIDSRFTIMGDFIIDLPEK